MLRAKNAFRELRSGMRSGTRVPVSAFRRPAKDGTNKTTLTPNGNPATGGNPLCLFLKKNLVLKLGQMVVL